MNATTRPTAARTADVVIIGGGVIGLSTTLELARAGLSCVMLVADQPGAASGAAAGLLAPSVGHLRTSAQSFFDASLRAYGEFIEPLRELDSQLRLLDGLIEVRREDDPATPPIDSRLLDASDVAAREPHLAAPNGAWLHPTNGAIDNVRLVRALRSAVEQMPGVTILDATPAGRIALEPTFEVSVRNGRAISAGWVVVAAGAWSPTIEGLPRKLPVMPLKGQMLAIRSQALHGPVMGSDVYLVPRIPEGEVVIGATAEHRGFDLSVSPEAIDGLRQQAIALCPRIGSEPVVRTWAGIRPATPDMLPILGPDPEAPSLVYACGHSKNGILLAPATARFVTSCVLGQPCDLDVSPFAPDRFDRSC